MGSREQGHGPSRPKSVAPEAALSAPNPDAFVAGSKIKSDLYHVTSPEAAQSIRDGGFKITKGKVIPQFGQGIYFNDTVTDVHQPYGGGGERITARADLQKPLQIDLTDSQTTGEGVLRKAQKAGLKLGPKNQSVLDAEEKKHGKNVGSDYDRQTRVLREDLNMDRDEFVKSLQQQGYDGLIVDGTKSGRQVVVYDPKKVLVTSGAPSAPETPTQTSGPGTTVGGLSTKVEDLGLDPATTKLITRNMKSKGFTLTEDKQKELIEAKASAISAIADKLGYTPEQKTAATDTLNKFMSRWYMTGGQSTERRDMEAAWLRLRHGTPQDSDVDRAAALQKAYTDMTWDTREMGDSVPVLRGVGGDYANKIALAEALGEDWSARTYPLTSWAIPDAEKSVNNWVVDGIKLKSPKGATRDNVFAMYHGEPLLREKGLKVKGEYILDGTGALSSDDLTVEDLHGHPPAGYVGKFSMSSGSSVQHYVDEGKRFHDQTGGDVDDFVLGQAYDGYVDSANGGYNLKDFESAGNKWKVLGFEEPPASMRVPITTQKDIKPPEGKSYISYTDEIRLVEEANNPKRYAVAQDLKARGLDAEKIATLLTLWSDWTRNKNGANEVREALKLPIDPDAKYVYGKPTAPRSERQVELMKENVDSYEEEAQAALDKLTALRKEIGIDDVALPDPFAQGATS